MEPNKAPARMCDPKATNKPDRVRKSLPAMADVLLWRPVRGFVALALLLSIPLCVVHAPILLGTTARRHQSKAVVQGNILKPRRRWRLGFGATNAVAISFIAPPSVLWGLGFHDLSLFRLLVCGVRILPHSPCPPDPDKIPPLFAHLCTLSQVTFCRVLSLPVACCAHLGVVPHRREGEGGRRAYVPAAVLAKKKRAKPPVPGPAFSSGSHQGVFCPGAGASMDLRCQRDIRLLPSLSLSLCPPPRLLSPTHPRTHPHRRLTAEAFVKSAPSPPIPPRAHTTKPHGI